jgi:adenylate cyclase
VADAPSGGRRRWRGLAVFPVAIVAIASAALTTFAFYSGSLKRVELSLYDARLSIGRPELDLRPVVIVAIDPQAESDLGQSFPFKRQLHARMIDSLRRAGAKVIAYDIEFNRPTDEANDLALLDSLDRARGRVVLAASEVSDRGETNILGGSELLRAVGARTGDSGLLFDSDGVIRRLTFRPHYIPTFAETAAQLSGAPLLQASDYTREPSGISAGDPDVRTSWINFAGEPGTVPTYSFSRVLRRLVPNDALRGKIVVVGATDPGAGDVHRTPASGSHLMSGPEIQANAIATTLHSLPLRSASTGIDLALIGLLSVIPAFAGGRLRLGFVLLISAALLAASLVGAQIAFEQGRVVAVSYPLLALLLSTAGAVGLRYLTALRARRRTHQMFARFVPEQVVDEAMRRKTDSDLRVPVRLDATVLFSDLRGFTAFAENLPEETLSAVLNRYLSSMSDAITTERGTIVSYMGDGIMAVFGAPAASEDHADRALAAARSMLVRLEDFNAHLRAERLGDGFRMGIGLNTGPVISGNVGSDRHLEYSTIGDTTNTAARLEAMTKESGHTVLIAQSTRDRLSDAAEDVVSVGEMQVRGRAAGVAVWTLSP